MAAADHDADGMADVREVERKLSSADPAPPDLALCEHHIKLLLCSALYALLAARCSLLVLRGAPSSFSALLCKFFLAKKETRRLADGPNLAGPIDSGVEHRSHRWAARLAPMAPMAPMAPGPPMG